MASDTSSTTGDAYPEIKKHQDHPALRTQAVSVGYPTSDGEVIEEQSIDIPANCISALIGPNGSGKSTFLKALARHLHPSEGRILLDGDDIDSLNQREFARRLGILFQEHPAPGSMTVEQLAYQGRYPHRGLFSGLTDEDHRVVNDAFALADLEHLRDREINQLSGGQRQLAWIVMALAQQPDILLLDEPTTFLDLRHQLEVMQIIQRLRDERDMTIVVVLHDINRAVRCADHLLVMRDGAIYDSGPPLEVLTRDLLRNVFDVEAEILRDEKDRPVCIPNAVRVDDNESGM